MRAVYDELDGCTVVNEKDFSSVENQRGSFKLGEEIANGVRYWGKETKVKKKRIVACICPKCDSEFRADIYNVITGKTGGCDECG